MAAPLAGVSTLRLDAEPLGRALALGAGKTLPEPNIKQVLQACLVIGETLEESRDSVGFLCHALGYILRDYVWQGDNRRFLLV